MAFYNVFKTLAGPPLRTVYKPWIEGEENIPKEGAAILASNHNAVWDSVFLPAMIERELVFMGKADYFTGTGVKGWATKNFMKAVGTIPVDRSGGKGAASALQGGLDRLSEGKLFGIYPEGTRSPDGRLYRGRTGVARLALQSGAPVIPVAMFGTHDAQPVGQALPSRIEIGMKIGKPLDFSRYRGLDQDRYTLRAITDEIMYNLMLLSGQEYVDLYAADVKARLAEEGKFAGPIPAGAKIEVKDTAGGETVAVEETVEERSPEELDRAIVEVTDKMYEADVEADKLKSRLRRAAELLHFKSKDEDDQDTDDEGARVKDAGDQGGGEVSEVIEVTEVEDRSPGGAGEKER